MPRTRKSVKRFIPSDSSDEGESQHNETILTSNKQMKEDDENDSSSESDIENYLQPVDKIDLNSSFFKLQKTDVVPSFDKIENAIFSGVTRLSDSDSENEEHDQQTDAMLAQQDRAPPTTKLNFQKLHEFTKRLEEAKKHVEQYNAKKEATKCHEDISTLLAAGETKGTIQTLDDLAENASLHSSDFESCSDSEKGDWEEVKTKDKDVSIPKQSLQITVEMPQALKKKKGTDLLAAMKRRLNRIKKENQVFIHKVHLLCWIAHGNYVNSIMNNENILCVALSLLPSENCYPEGRTNLKYLEQIVQWYRKTIKLSEQTLPDNVSLSELLQLQMNRKEAFNKSMLAYLFIAILRSLGIQCRLVISFQVEPLRPPNSELCSLSTSTNKEKPPKKVNTSEQQNKPTTSTKKKTRKSNNVKKESITGKERGASSSSNLNHTEFQSGNKEDAKIKKQRKRKIIDNSGRSSTIAESKSNLIVDQKESRKRTKSADSLKPAQNEMKTRSKSTSDSAKAGTKNIIKIKLRTQSNAPESKSRLRNRNNNIPQVDGMNDSDSGEDLDSSFSLNNLLQIDGSNDSDNSTTNKPNLRNIQKRESSTKTKNVVDSGVDIRKQTRSTVVNLNKLKDGKKVTSNPPSNVDKSKYFRNTRTKTLDVRNDIQDLIKGRIKAEKQSNISKTVRKRKNTNDSDSDYAPEPIKKKYHESDDDFVQKTPVKQRVQVKPLKRKVISSDSEDEKPKARDKNEKSKKGIDVWAEVFLEHEEMWISVDVAHCQIHCVKEIYKRASHPVAYVVAWSNDNHLKDITKRYCQNYNTVTRKLRVDLKWWEESIKPFLGSKTTRDKEEDDEFERQQLEKPLPTSIAEYKNHPLYVLRRHLLKFEGIYPSDAPSLGFVRNEPVYSRQCVYTLHSRDIWLKHAKVVKRGEKPYKIVKARPKYDKLSNSVITDQMLEIFGPWQTEDYVPPTAENGIVPRNAFGNVELFKSCMLPKKTVHLKLPGLNKVARKLNIDCASAIVGFDFHSGWSHPTYDGFVVCEEYADTLIAAWEMEQEELERKETEKIEKRVYDNWKRLIRGLLIRERLKAKYNFGSTSRDGEEKKKKKPPRFGTKKKMM